MRRKTLGLAAGAILLTLLCGAAAIAANVGILHHTGTGPVGRYVRFTPAAPNQRTTTSAPPRSDGSETSRDSNPASHSTTPTLATRSTTPASVPRAAATTAVPHTRATTPPTTDDRGDKHGDEPAHDD